MFIELLARGSRALQPRIGWIAVFLLLTLSWIVGTGIMEADWVADDILFVYVSIVGLLVGVTLAALHMPGAWAGLLTALGGVLFVGHSVAQVIPPIPGAVQELWALVNWLALRIAGVEVSLPTLSLWQESARRLVTLADRMTLWAVGLVEGQVTVNAVAFLVVAGLLLWGAAAWAGWWTIRRGKPLLAMLPMGLLLSMSTYLSSEQVGWMVAFAACVAALVPTVLHRAWEHGWEVAGVDYSPEIRFEVAQVTALLTTGIVLFSLITPSVSIPRLVWEFWELIQRPQEAVEEALTRLFGGVEPDDPPDLPAPGSAAGGYGPLEASLPRSHLLGGNPNLRAQRVMYVCIDAPTPVIDDLIGGLVDEYIGPHYYWRGVTYDTFSGWYWDNAPSQRESIDAYQPVLASTITATESLRQRYIIEVPHGNTLYAVGEPSAVDQPVYSRLREPDDLVGLEGTISDYVVVSQVSVATARQLQEAPADYAPAIADLYLALPDDTPRRVTALAAEITDGIESPYDRARAIERYLRQFPYDLDVPPPRPKQNVVDYFLFDAQRGYCDYFGSSFVVLARAAGIPSRLAVGYAMGGYDPERGCYAVAEADGHSWPEVYFPGYGWTPFEPTVSFRTFERPEEPTQPRDGGPRLPSVPRRPPSLAVEALWAQIEDRGATYVGLAALAGLLLIYVRQAYRWWWLNRLDPLQAIALAYGEMARLGERLGTPRRASDTPAEYARILEKSLDRRVVRWPWRARRLSETVREASGRVRVLSRLYERASYGRRHSLAVQQAQAQRHWERLKREMEWLWVASVEEKR